MQAQQSSERETNKQQLEASLGCAEAKLASLEQGLGEKAIMSVINAIIISIIIIISSSSSTNIISDISLTAMNVKTTILVLLLLLIVVLL